MTTRRDSAGPAGVVSWLAYPLAMALVIGLFGVLRPRAPLFVATYAPILFAAGLVTWLERRLPHRTEWRPGTREVGVDLAFMAFVQSALPPLVGFAFTYLLVQPVRSLGLPSAFLWPHGWPIWLQALLMILVVDFLRYWLHRFAHENATLWRVHSVHHSVEQLYWLNTGRFHPVEKTLQMLCDSLPFLLLGVHEEVLALYYVAYASNGFFQHCNVRLRYGFLNYIVGSAETHRWHHSREPKESNANYGSTVAVWDVVFGTWYLPPARDVADLGLVDRDYPRSFVGLLRAPFRR